jgi:hypothetical protein
MRHLLMEIITKGIQLERTGRPSICASSKLSAVASAIFEAPIAALLMPSRRKLSALAPEQRADAAEIVEQLLCEQLCSDARYGQREQIFDELIIMGTAHPGVEQPLSQPRAVAGGIIVAIDAGVLVHATLCARLVRAWHPDHRKRRNGRGHAASGTVMDGRG